MRVQLSRVLKHGEETNWDKMRGRERGGGEREINWLPTSVSDPDPYVFARSGSGSALICGSGP